MTDRDPLKKERGDRIVWRNPREEHVKITDDKAGTVYWKGGRDMHIDGAEREVRGKPPAGIIEERYDPKRHGDWRGKKD